MQKHTRPINNRVFAYILINIRLCFYWPTTFLYHVYTYHVKAFVKRNTIITYLLANKKQCLSDFWNVLSAAATTRFFIVSTSVVSVLVITGNVLVQLSHLKKRRGRPPKAINSLKISRATKSLKKSTTLWWKTTRGWASPSKTNDGRIKNLLPSWRNKKRCGGVGQSSANKVRGHQDSAN